jgi:protocatechuate 3,4-dioxygenase beta subunit
MGKPARRSQWGLVLALLAGALLLTGALLYPRTFTGEGHAGRLASGRDAEREEGGARGGEEAPPAAAAEQPAAPEELPPYGDRSLALDESIRGRVSDREGKPVADAIVVARYRDWRTQPSPMVSTARVRTEADGFFVIGPLERQAYAVAAEKEGLGIAYSANVQVGAWVDLTLAPGARLSGTVTARETREPVAGAAVVVHEWTFRSETKTDAEGKYAFAALPPPANAWQGFSVVAVAEGWKRGERTNLVPRGGREYRLDFTLDKGNTLTGRVVDKEQRPLAGAIVAEGWETFHRTVTTGADGTYSLPNVDTAPNLVYVARADGYLPQQRQSDGTGALDFELSGSLSLEGVVTDRRDAPLKGARIYLHRISFAPGAQPDQGNRAQNFTTSGEGGSFRFESVLPGQVAVVAFHRDHGPGEKHPLDVPVGGPGPKDVRVRLSEGLAVEGEVRDRDERPLASVSVQVQGWEMVPGFQFVPQYRWQENPVTCTDDQGRFKLRGALPGKQWLQAYHVTYGWTGQQVEGADGQRLTDIRISFAGGMIEGQILTAAREPVGRAQVNARGPKNTPQMTYRYVETDGLGRFRLGGLPEGRYDIHANLQMGGNADPALDIPTGTTNVEIVLKPTQSLEGEVRSSISGRALERFFLSIQADPTQPGDRRSRRQSTQWQNWIQAPDGRFEVTVVPGRYQIVVKAPGHQPRVLDGVVVEEIVPPSPLDIMLDAGGGIEGTLKDVEGKPVANVHIQARVFRGAATQQTDWILGGNDQTDDRGRYFLEGLGAGSYILQANMGERGAATARVSVAGAERVRHDLTLVPTGTLTIKAVDEEGKPVPAIYFQFMDDEQNWLGWAGETDQNGQAQSQPMRAGPAILSAYDEQQQWTCDPMRVEILSGRVAPVEVTLKKKEGG